MRALKFAGHQLGRRSVIAIAAIVAAMGFAVVAVAASLPGSDFEIDDNANLVVNTAGNDDWASIPQGSAPGTEIRKADTLSGSTDESFGNGTKEDTAEPSVVDGSIPPNKSDLKFFGVYQEGTGSDGFLNLFWARVQDPSGTTNMDFEFNKRQCTPGLTPADADCAPNGITPKRSAGDLLIIYDLARGGTVPNLSLREWNGSAWGSATDLTASNKATGSINTTAISGANSDGLGALDPRTFGEAQIALSAILDPNECEGFGSAYLKSRASDSFTAALKDFVPPAAVNVANCATVKVTKTGSDGGTQAGAVFTLYEGSDTTGTVVGTCTVLANGDCDPVFDSLPGGTYTINETTVPAGYDKAPDLPQTFTVAAGDLLELAFVNEAAPGTVEVTKVDDAGDPVGGVTFTLYSPAGSTNGVPTGVSVGSCVTDAITGGCTISNVTPGTYTIDETVPAALGYAKDPAFPQNITISNGETEAVAATNPRQFKTIVLVCNEVTDTLYPSAITIDGQSAGNSLSSAQATTAGLSQSALCAITQGARGGLRAAPHASNPHDADVNLPNSQP